MRILTRNWERRNGTECLAYYWRNVDLKICSEDRPLEELSMFAPVYGDSGYRNKLYWEPIGCFSSGRGRLPCKNTGRFSFVSVVVD